MEEKEHDLEMNSRNLEQLKEMLEEKSQSSESNQQERLKNIAGKSHVQSEVNFLVMNQNLLSEGSLGADKWTTHSQY